MNITHLNAAYDLDGGGYSFEDPPEGLTGLGVVVWDDPDPDYIPWVHDVAGGFHGLRSPLYAFAPNDGHFQATEWPDRFQDGDYDYRLVAQGSLNGTDHDCWCHGHLAAWTGATGEPTAPLPAEKVAEWLASGKATVKRTKLGSRGFYWKADEDGGGNAYPECPRCDGDGYVDSVGGEWALYEDASEDA